MVETPAQAGLRHELRTPLNHIIGYAEMMLEDAESNRAAVAPRLQVLIADARVLLERIGALEGDAEELLARLRERPEQLTAPLASVSDAIAGVEALLDAGGDPAARRDVERMRKAAARLRALIQSQMPPPEGAPAQARAPASDTTGAAILVVDDNENNREVLTRRLAREGYKRVTHAADGREALELLRTQRFDLVLLDIMMPEVDGYQVLEAMKQDEAMRTVPVIMISAIDEMKSVIRCIEQGAEDYLSKPFDATLLRARVRATLEKKRLRDEVLEWNRTLEARVQEQLAQVERLARLKGFLSPQVVEAIVEAGEAALQVRRREVVVVFLDLRGFTAFTDASPAEDVMAMLGAYRAAMVRIAMAHDGTLERFIGDGLMIVFNDPLPATDPAGCALTMALEMQGAFAALRQEWAARGRELGLGIGIAMGEATVGAIGFEGRWDYTCIGSVANLAARLCAEARSGQILVAASALERAERRPHAEAVGEMSFKGLSQAVPVWSVTG